MSNETLAASYSTAVGSALVVAFGLATLIQKRCTPDRAQQLMKFVAFPSAVVASSLNCYIVRSPEIESGIPLLDANYQPVILEDGSPAISKAAAAQGVYSTTLSRAILQAPVYFLPPVLMGVLPPLSQAIERNPRLRVPLTTALVLVSFGLGLPATTAIFPQMTSIPATDVEAPFQNLQSAHTQTPYTVYYYNKGL